MDFTHSCPSILLETKPPPMKPSTAALRTLFVASAVPMVGFGAMDNFVMIQAGQYIDSTLGVQLGLATMTAAAAGGLSNKKTRIFELSVFAQRR